MKPMRLALLIVFLSASVAYADFYYWKDADGVTHMADSMEKVPQEYRTKVKVRTTPHRAPEPEAPASSPRTSGETQQPQPVEEYGDHTLEWWKESFRRLKSEIERLEADLNAKRDFVSLVETGMRVGQLYEAKDVERYNNYKKEIPDDEAKLASLKDEREELRRKAKIVGVPKALWEE
ncbi:MAG: DUF4124 domain-containing protein [Deltaproteobacteria bacterium]|nr:DUF4124 domain-containing protein [Deltaproteobacteria bacterium]